jgi:hypothetical protein
MSDIFTYGPGWQQSSEPTTVVDVHEADVWPVDDNSGSGTKDSLLNAAGEYDGVHPVVAIGGRTAADGRPLNLTGVVVSVTPGLTVATSHVRVDVADGKIVRNWVANVLTYDGGNAATFEQAPVVGQPVYVDDSDDLGEGVTLSLSPLNDAGVKNPLAGYLWYCQDEMANVAQGGARAAATFDTALANELVEQEYCVLLVNAARELA